MNLSLLHGKEFGDDHIVLIVAQWNCFSICFCSLTKFGLTNLLLLSDFVPDLASLLFLALSFTYLHKARVKDVIIQLSQEITITNQIYIYIFGLAC